MATLNQVICVGSTGNVAVPDCVHNPGRMVGVILIRKGKTFAPSDLVDFQTTLSGLAQDDDRKKRIFLLGRFVDMEDKSTDPTMQKYGYGDEVEIDDGRYKGVFIHRNGMCYHKKLLAFSGAHTRYEALLVDHNWNIIGTAKKGVGGVILLGGLSLSSLFVPKWKFASGSKETEHSIGIALADTAQLNKHYAFVQCDFDPMDAVVGLMDVTLTDLTTIALPVGQYQVGMTAGCESTNFADLYSTQLLASHFVLKNALTNLVIPVTSISVNATGALLTVNAASPNYPAIGGQMTLTLVAPSVMKAAGIEGYEANTITIKRLQ